MNDIDTIDDTINDTAEATYAAASAMFDDASALYDDAVATLADAISTLNGAKAMYEESAKETCKPIIDMPSSLPALARLRLRLSQLSDEERSAVMRMLDEGLTLDERCAALEQLFDSDTSRPFLAAFFRLTFLFDADKRRAAASVTN
jgi:hypothetical protein